MSILVPAVDDTTNMLPAVVVTALANSGAIVDYLNVDHFGAAGDGTTDDTSAIQATITAAGARPIRFGRTPLGVSKTYKVTAALTFGGDADLNRATISTTASVNVTGTFRNGKVTGPGSVVATSQSKVLIEKLEVVATSVTSQGIYLNQCTDSVVRNCKVSGGSFRGILLARCDRFTISENSVNDVTDPAGYGILVTSATGEVHGDGTIRDNVLYNCNLGICANGGEANPSQPAYTGQRTLQSITITGNKVYMLSYAAHSGIWATCATGLLIEGNYVNGSSDTGIDLEYVTQSVVQGNYVVDVLNGGLSAIFGCTDILFASNSVQFNRTVASTVTTSGVTWKGTGWLPVLLRDNPQRITFVGNTFRSSNATLGQLSLGDASGNVTFADNTLRDCYMVDPAATQQSIVRLTIRDNQFTFTQNLNNPAIYVERPLKFYCEDNHISLIGGEVLESMTRQYIAVFDTAGAVADQVFIRNNVIDNLANPGGGGISLYTNSTSIKAWVVGNIADKIGVISATYTGITMEKNYKASSVGLLGATVYNSTTAVTMPTVA